MRPQRPERRSRPHCLCSLIRRACETTGRGGFKSVDLSANVFPFMVMNFAYLISASRLTERADIANGVSQRGARLCHEGYPHTLHFGKRVGRALLPPTEFNSADARDGVL